MPQGGFLKLAWLSMSVEKPALQCLWADGKRLSRATIAGRSEQSLSGSSWTVTIDTQHLRQLVGYVRPRVAGQALKDEQFPLSLTLETHRRESHLHFSSIGVSGTGAAETISCTLAGLPGVYPSLRSPISSITVQHSVLVDALQFLEQQWYATNGENQHLTTLELSFGASGPDALLTLSVGPLVYSIPVREIVLPGPPVRLRLDFAVLQSIIAVRQEQEFFWRIATDRELSVAQLSPDPVMFDDAMLPWLHQVWTVFG